jgi:hypothetical protein
MGQSRISLVDISAGELEYIRIVHLVSCALEEKFAVFEDDCPDDNIDIHDAVSGVVCLLELRAGSC